VKFFRKTSAQTSAKSPTPWRESSLGASSQMEPPLKTFLASQHKCPHAWSTSDDPDRSYGDIDLVLDWGILGFGRTFGSKTKRNKFNIEINEAAKNFIGGTLCPQIDDLVKSQNLGLTASVDADDPHVVNIHYSAAFSEAYIRPEVRLEIGPLASWVPSAPHKIRPYIFDVLPSVLEDPDCPVVAIAAERTFWEKATILHQEAHRKAVIPQRHSRHYYDLYKLALSPVREAAFTNLKLLADVVDFKKRFYPSAWAR
jgi:hypothetical protein